MSQAEQASNIIEVWIAMIEPPSHEPQNAGSREQKGKNPNE